LHSRVLTTNLSNPSVKNKTFQSLVNHRHRVCISSDVVSVEKQRIPNFDRSKTIGSIVNESFDGLGNANKDLPVSVYSFLLFSMDRRDGVSLQQVVQAHHFEIPVVAVTYSLGQVVAYLLDCPVVTLRCHLSENLLK